MFNNNNYINIARNNGKYTDCFNYSDNIFFDLIEKHC